MSYVRQLTIYPISDDEASDLEVTWAYLIMLIRCIRGGGVPNEATRPAGNWDGSNRMQLRGRCEAGEGWGLLGYVLVRTT